MCRSLNINEIENLFGEVSTSSCWCVCMCSL